MLAGHDVEPKLHLILDPDPRSPRLTNPVHEQGSTSGSIWSSAGLACTVLLQAFSGNSD